MWARTELVFVAVKILIPFGLKRSVELLLALYHRWTYRSLPHAKNIVVLGGSFCGISLAQRLAEVLPTGYKIVLIERNSQFHYLFNFPRYSVYQGHEQYAFIPYDNILGKAPAGIFEHIKGEAVSITGQSVRLRHGRTVEYDHLAIATGSSQPFPSRLTATDRDEACAELRHMQQQIESAERIAVVGGGAVGIELSTDIKSFYPEKTVALIHSHQQLLNSFGEALQRHVFAKLEELGVEILLGERPPVPSSSRRQGQQTLRFSDGTAKDFDLVIPCTCQVANSNVLATFAPSAISPATGQIMVKPTLQLAGDDADISRVYALGDVADTGAPKMARAGFFQSRVVAENIYSSIRNRPVSGVYHPLWSIEGSLKLTLGKSDVVLYLPGAGGSGNVIPAKSRNLDLDIGRAWKMYGARLHPIATIESQTADK